MPPVNPALAPTTTSTNDAQVKVEVKREFEAHVAPRPVNSAPKPGVAKPYPAKTNSTVRPPLAMATTGSNASITKAQTQRKRGDQGGHECPVCKAKLSRADHLSRHIKSVHGVKRFHCEYCKKAFGRNDEFQRHRKIHATAQRFGFPETVEKPSTAFKLEEERLSAIGATSYECFSCLRKFKHRTKLLDHECDELPPQPTKKQKLETESKKGESSASLVNPIATSQHREGQMPGERHSHKYEPLAFDRHELREGHLQEEKQSPGQYNEYQRPPHYSTYLSNSPPPPRASTLHNHAPSRSDQNPHPQHGYYENHSGNPQRTRYYPPHIQIPSSEPPKGYKRFQNFPQHGHAHPKKDGDPLLNLVAAAAAAENNAESFRNTDSVRRSTAIPTPSIPSTPVSHRSYHTPTSAVIVVGAPSRNFIGPQNEPSKAFSHLRHDYVSPHVPEYEQRGYMPPVSHQSMIPQRHQQHQNLDPNHAQLQQQYQQPPPQQQEEQQHQRQWYANQHAPPLSEHHKPYPRDYEVQAPPTETRNQQHPDDGYSTGICTPSSYNNQHHHHNQNYHNIEVPSIEEQRKIELLELKVRLLEEKLSLTIATEAEMKGYHQVGEE
ncbi:hypothetical protein BDR26DRAFT_852679 [Obelidium mucronatum]|nr:hypothetical protein BDR26DRAFT_852679 [Obelidium mucronatum]